MLYATYDDGPLPSYKKYKNKAFEKYNNRTKQSVSLILSGSLKESDKEKLLKSMRDIIDSELLKMNKA